MQYTQQITSQTPSSLYAAPSVQVVLDSESADLSATSPMPVTGPTVEQTRPGTLLAYSREELIGMKPKTSKKLELKLPAEITQDPTRSQHYQRMVEHAKKLTHKEMLEAVEIGTLTSLVYEREMARRKRAKEQRKALRAKEIVVKEQFVMQTPHSKTSFSVDRRVDAISQMILNKPLSVSDFKIMTDWYTDDKPWFREKMRELQRKLLPGDLEYRLNVFALSPYKKGTVEYWVDLVWGSRRRRDKFIEHMFDDVDYENLVGEVQGDEPVLEEESTLAGTGNITFVEERAVDSDATHLNGPVSTKDPQMNMAERPWTSINEVLTREVVVYRGEWNETQNDVIYSVGLPKALFEQRTFLRQQASLYAFLRAGVEVRIQFNGNRFAAGSLVAVIMPPMFEEDVPSYSYLQAFNWPHIRLDATVSNVGTLFVPYSHILSHFPQQRYSLENDSIVTLGRLMIYVVNPLRVAPGANNVLSYTVYAKLVNPELHQTTWPVNDFAYSEGIITQAAEEGLFKRILGGGLSTALGAFLSKMTGGLATGIGSLLTGLIFDYPHDPMPPGPIVNQAVGPVCYGAGVDHSTRLALTPISQTETDDSILGSTNGDFNLLTLLKTPSLLKIGRWSSSENAGDELFSMPVTPVWLPNSRLGTVSQETANYDPTLQAYISRAFCYWRGGLKLKIQFVKTEFNNGRVLVAYIPQVNTETWPEIDPQNSIEYYMQSNAVIVDIEEHKEVVIDLPYMSPRPWLRCDALRTDASFVDNPTDFRYNMSYLAESFNGFLKVVVLNRLVSPSNVPQEIDVNYFLYCDDDFELAYPASLSPLNVKSFKSTGNFGGFEEYPFVLTPKPNPEVPIEFQLEFENKMLIDSVYYDGARLYTSRRIQSLKGKMWYESTPTQYLGTTSDEVVNWCYKVSLLKQYYNATIKTVQWEYMSFLPPYNLPEFAETQGLEEYTTGRSKESESIVSTAGKRTCEVAPTTISENAMNLQTILRRFYCIYNSYPLYSQSGYTVVSVPVNPTVVPTLRFPIVNTQWPGNGEALPIDQIAWFTKLYTYWRGSLRYKFVYDASLFDVEAIHVPTECRPFSVRQGVKEIDIQKLMAYGSAISVAHLQGSLEVEVPFANPYLQCFIDVHDRYYNLLCQNGTLFFFFRNKQTMSTEEMRPTSFTLFRSTGEDFVFNRFKAPPLIEEPVMRFGFCDGSAGPVTLPFPELVRNLGNDSEKVVLPGGTGIKKLDKYGYGRYCVPPTPTKDKNPENAETQGNEDWPVKPVEIVSIDEVEAETQMFQSGRKAVSSLTALAEKLPDGDAVSEMVTEIRNTNFKIQEAATTLNTTLIDSKLKETMQSLNCISSKIDALLPETSTAKPYFVENETIQRYTLLAAEVVLCGTFIHHVRATLQEPTLPNFVTLSIELGLIVGLTVSETLQSLVQRVVDWALDFPVLNKPEQAQAQTGNEATDFLDDNCGVICAVVAVIGTTLYAYLFGALPSFDKIKDAIKSFFESDDSAEPQNLEKTLGFSLKNAHFSLLGIGALEKVYNKMLEWAQKFVFWILDKENPEYLLAKAAEDVKERVLKVIAELDDLDYEPNFIAALEDPLVHNRFYKLQQEVYELTAACTESKIDQKVVILLTECRRRSIALIKRMEKERCTASQRYDPFVVCIHGETGAGKTKFAAKIFEIYQKVMNLPPQHLLYSKNIRDDFWSGYTNQPVVFWDEFGQAKDADKVAVPEFMTLRGDKPVKVNMAALEDKGRDFTSQGIVLTTNVPYQRYDSIRDNDALMRRRHIMIGMQHRNGFDANVLQEARHDQFPNFEHCSFGLTHNTTGAVIRAGMTMQEVLDHVETKMTDWHENQLASLAQQPDTELPRGIVLTPQEDEDDDYFEDAVEGLGFNLQDEVVRFVPEVEAEVQGWESVLAYFHIDPEVELTDAERFVAEMFLAKMELESQVKLKVKYLKYKQKVKMAPSRLYNLAVKTFENLKNTVIKFWQDHPRVCKVLGVLTLLGSVGAIMHFRTKNETETYDSGPAKTPQRRVIAEGTYESGPSSKPKIRVISEGSEDQQAVEISKKIAQYTYPIKWQPGSVRSAQMNCVHIGGHVIMAPYHFFQHAKEGEFFDLLHRVHPVAVEFIPTRMVQLEDKDWVLYDCGVRLQAGKQLQKFFINENDLSKVHTVKCMLLTRDPENFDIVRDSGSVKSQQKFSYKDPKWGDVYVQNGWQHDLNTTAGQCGGPLILCSNSIPSPGKIGGIHVAGFRNKSVGFCVLVTKQMVEKALEKLPMQFGDPPVPQCVDIGLSKALRVLPEGDFTIVGQMPDKMAPAQPQKSTFLETPFFEQVEKELGPAPRIPAKLRQFENEEGQRISPLKRSIDKYGYQTVPYSARNIRKVRNYMVHLFDQKLTKHTGKRVFTIPEAVNGLPGIEYAEKIKMQSSAGWPYQIENRKPGKWHLFDQEGNIVDPQLAQNLETRRDAAKMLQRVPSVWRDCMKDELRPVAKVMAGKTRLFTIAPVDFTILTRQMFLDFVMAFYDAHRGDFFSAVGINPESIEWTELYNYLAEYNNVAVAGDYECFDGKEMPEIMMAVCDIINAWYGDSTENQNIRETLFIEMIHTMQLCENLVYMTHQGNPSGNPLTTPINTIVNVFLLILTWLEIFPEKSVDDFFQNVRVKAYGDDNLVVPKESVIEKFNQNTIAAALYQHNIVYTAETKTVGMNKDARSLKEVTFLKRGFRKDKEFGNFYMLPTMAIDTLNSYFYYYRSAPNVESQLQENQRSALVFASFHGRKFYDEYLQKWKRFMKESDLESLQISFEEQVDCFKYGAGILETKPLTTGTNLDICPEGMDSFIKITNSKPARLMGGLLEAPFYLIGAALGILSKPSKEPPTDNRWAVAIPSGEGKSTLAKTYPWLFADHDELLLPQFQKQKGSLPWKADVARKYDFPEEDRRILLVHHPSFTNRRLVGSFITPFPTFIRVNCIQRLRMHKPVKMPIEERNILLVQICSSLEEKLRVTT